MVGTTLWSQADVLSRCSQIQEPARKKTAKPAPSQDARQNFATEEVDSQSTRSKLPWNLENTSLVAPGGRPPADPNPASLRLQPKLRIGAVNDPLEREADFVAEQVMRMPDPVRSTNSTRSDLSSESVMPDSPPMLRRKCCCGGSCETCRQQEREEGAATLQTKPRAGADQRRDATGAAPASIEQVLRSSGRSLDSAARNYFEPRFHFDFSRVRLHADAAAAASARAVDARAYTVGSHIVLGAGELALDTAAGRRLLAHELTHVVQQSHGVPLEHAAPSGHGASATPIIGSQKAAPRIAQRSPDPMLMRAPLLSSTMQICKRVLKGEHTFPVSQGGIIVTIDGRGVASSEWEGSELPKCDIDEFHVTVTQKGRLWDSEYGDCTFQAGGPYSRQWAELPEGDYYLTISKNDTNPACCLEGSVEVSQQQGLSGASCTQPPPGPLEMLHDALNVAGLIPALGAIPDGINAGIYVIQGDWTNAGISAIAMIPVLGDTANIVKIGEKTAVRVSGEAVEKIGAKEMGAGLKEAKAAQAAKLAKEAEAAKAGAAIAKEVKLSKEEYEAALKMVFPSQYVDPVAKLVDDIGQSAAKRAMENPKFVKAMEDGNWTLAGTYFHTAAKEEARAIPKSILPAGWSLEAEKTIQSGAGGSRADLFLKGPGSDLVEFDWKTSGKSALSSGSRKEMAKHAGQVTVHMGNKLSAQESRSWMDYVRPFL